MILTKPVLLIGGKGGVGKTTLAASLALLKAGRGQNTLLISTDPAHSLSDLFRRTIGPDPVPVVPFLSAMELDPDKETESYLEEVKSNISGIAHPNIREEAYRQIDLARFSPGAEEYALFYRFAKEIGRNPQDRSLVFDTAPTGHTLRLLRLPEVMRNWLSGFIQKEESHGKVRDIFSALSGGGENRNPVPGLDSVRERMDLFRSVREILTDGTQTDVVMVCNPDTLSVRETEMSVRRLGEMGVRVRHLLVNKSLQEPSGESQADRGYPTRKLEEIREIFPNLTIRPVPLVQTELLGLDALTEFSHRLGELLPA